MSTLSHEQPVERCPALGTLGVGPIHPFFCRTEQIGAYSVAEDILLKIVKKNPRKNQFYSEIDSTKERI